MASSRASCTHYIYNVPADMDQAEINEMLRPLIGDGDEKFIKKKLPDNAKRRLVLTFEKPVELLEESCQFRDQHIFILPEMVDRTVVVLNKQWADKLKRVKLNTIVLPGVSVTTNNEVVTLEGKKETVDQSLVKLQEAVEKLLLQNVNTEDQGTEMMNSGWQQSPGKDESHRSRKLKQDQLGQKGDEKSVLENSSVGDNLSHSVHISPSHSPRNGTDERVNPASFVPGLHQSGLPGEERTEEDPSGDNRLIHNSFESQDRVENDLHKSAVREPFNVSAAEQKECKSDDAANGSDAQPSDRNITADVANTKMADYQKPVKHEVMDELVEGMGKMGVNSDSSGSLLQSYVIVDILRLPTASHSSSVTSQVTSHTPLDRVDQQNSPSATGLVLHQNSDVSNGGKLQDQYGHNCVIDNANKSDTTISNETQDEKEMKDDLRHNSAEKAEAVGCRSANQNANGASASMNVNNSATADAVNDKGQQDSKLSTASSGNDSVANKPDCFVIEEVIWQFILFSEPECVSKDMFTIKPCDKDNKKIVLKGDVDIVQKFKTFYGARQRVLARSIESRMQRIPQGYSAESFKGILDNLAKKKVLVRLTTDPEFCEVIGKSSDLDEFCQAVKIRFPGDKAATKKDIKPDVNNPLPPVSTVASSPTTAKATQFFGSKSSQSTHVNSHPTSPTSAAVTPRYPALPSSWPQPAIPHSSTPDCLELCLERSKIMVSVITGNILEQHCEVIVSPTSYQLDNRGGLAKIIANAAGHELQAACQEYIHVNKCVPVGKVMDTTCGLIPSPARRVIHACGPSLRQFKDEKICSMALKETFFNCLVTANDKLKARSIALPAISSGTFGVPYDAVALAACLALIQFDENRSADENKWLKAIKFVNINHDVTEVMVNKFKEILLQLKSAQVVVNKQQDVSKPLDYQKQSEYDKFCVLANRQGFSVVNVPRNGDSALYAIIDQLKYRGVTHWDVASLRQDGAKHLYRNQSLINWTIVQHYHNNDFGQYLRWLQTGNMFCDDNMLRSLAAVINMEIHLLCDNEQLAIYQSLTSHSDPLCIGLTSDFYYVSLIPANSIQGNQHPGNISQLSGETKWLADNNPSQHDSVSTSSIYTSKEFKELEAAADKRGLIVVPVQTGGDSALHAIIDQLNLQRAGLPFSVQSLRQEAVKYLQGQSSLIDDKTLRKSSVNDAHSYLTKQSVSNTPCDETMLTAIAEVIHHDIHILVKSGHFVNVDSKTATGKPLLIGLPVNGLFVSLHAKKFLNPINSQDNSQVGQNVSMEGDKSDKLDFSKLLSHTDKASLVIVNVSFGGDSAYYAVIDQLYRQGCTGYENDVTGLRKTSVEYLKSNRDLCNSQFFVNSNGEFEKYFHQQSRPGSQCDQLMLRCMAEVVQHNIHILHDNGQWKELATNSATGKPLLVGLVGEHHYVSLCSHDLLTSKDEPNIIRERLNQTDVRTASGSGVTVEKEEDKTKESCPICMDDINTPHKLPCGHVFCADCIDKSFSYQKKCPCCGKIFGELKGDQPEGGTMTTQKLTIDLPGYQHCGSIVIDYDIPGGLQKANHPNPGQWYSGARRTAYLPNNGEGQEICGLLQRAFDAGLIFTVGRSTTSGRDNVVTWNDIHHKTKPTGPFGYPDPAYLSRVRDELAAKGIKSTPPEASRISGESLSVSNSVQSPVSPADFAPVHNSLRQDHVHVAQDKPSTGRLYPHLSNDPLLASSPRGPVSTHDAAPGYRRQSSDTSMPLNMSPATVSSGPSSLGSNFNRSLSTSDSAGSTSSVTATTVQPKGAAGHTNLAATNIGDF